MKGCMRALLVAMVLMLLCTAVAETGSLSVHMHAGKTDVPNAIVVLYKIGNAHRENANLTFEINQEFAPSGITLDDINNKDIPRLLEAYAIENSLSAAQKKATNANGIASFSALQEGAYLVCQRGFSKKQYFTEFEPFIVTVPMTIDGEWSYSIATEPKSEPVPQPTPKPKPTKKPNESKLPQTGLLRWPIFALGVGGVTLFVLGWVLCFAKSGKRKNRA